MKRTGGRLLWFKEILTTGPVAPVAPGAPVGGLVGVVVGKVATMCSGISRPCGHCCSVACDVYLHKSETTHVYIHVQLYFTAYEVFTLGFSEFLRIAQA